MPELRDNITLLSDQIDFWTLGLTISTWMQTQCDDMDFERSATESREQQSAPIRVVTMLKRFGFDESSGTNWTHGGQVSYEFTISAPAKYEAQAQKDVEQATGKLIELLNRAESPPFGVTDPIITKVHVSSADRVALDAIAMTVSMFVRGA